MTARPNGNAPFRRLFVPGGGFVRQPDGTYDAAPRMKDRAAATIKYYQENQELFGPGSFIILSGGYQYGLEAPTDLNEAAWYKDSLERAGIPPHLYNQYIDPEPDDTAKNLISAVRKGLLKPDTYTPEHPLTFVKGEKPFNRAMLYIPLLGFAACSVVRLETGEIPGPAEDYLYAQTKIVLKGTPVGDLAALEARHAELVERLHHPDHRHHLMLAS